MDDLERYLTHASQSERTDGSGGFARVDLVATPQTTTLWMRNFQLQVPKSIIRRSI